MANTSITTPSTRWLNCQTHSFTTGKLAAMKSERLNKSRASNLSPRNWKRGGTNCCNNRASAFLIMFKTGQALLLRQRRVLRPRNGRGLDAKFPRYRPASRSCPWPVRDRVQTEASPHPRRDRGRVQSVTMSWPCPHPHPQSVHIHDRVRVANVRDQSMSANYPCPRPAHSRAQSVAVSSPWSWPVRDRAESAKCPGHDCIASAPQTIHLHILSAYVRL